MDNFQSDNSAFLHTPPSEQFEQQSADQQRLKQLGVTHLFHDHETSDKDPKNLSVLQSAFKKDEGPMETMFARPFKSDLLSLEALLVNKIPWSAAREAKMAPLELIEKLMIILQSKAINFCFSTFEQKVQEALAEKCVFDAPYLSVHHPYLDVRALCLLAINAGIMAIGNENGSTSTKLGSLCEANGIEAPDHTADCDTNSTASLSSQFIAVPEMCDLIRDKVSGRENYYERVINSRYVNHCSPYRKDGLMEPWSVTHNTWKNYVTGINIGHVLFDQPTLTSEDYRNIEQDKPKNLIRSLKTHGADVLLVPNDHSLNKLISTPEWNKVLEERAGRVASDRNLLDATKKCIQLRNAKRSDTQKPNFLPFKDKPVARRFHAAAHHEKYPIAIRFQSDHHRELALKVIWDVCPDSLPSAERARLDNLVEESWRCESLPGRTFSSARDDIELALSRGPSKQDLVIIKDYESIIDLLEKKGVGYA